MLCVHIHIETSSLWAEFVNKNRCINVCLESEEVKAFNFDNFENSHNSFVWPEYFINYFCLIPCQAVTFVFCLPFRPTTVHCSKKYAYTSVITFFALVPFNVTSCITVKKGLGKTFTIVFLRVSWELGGLSRILCFS